MAVSLLVLAGRTETVEFGAWVGLYAAAIAVAALADFGSTGFRTRELARDRGREHFVPWLLQRTAWQALPTLALSAAALVLARDHLPVVAVIALAAQALTMNVANGVLAAVRAVRSPVLAEWCVLAGNALLLIAVVAAPRGSLLTSAALAASCSWLVSAAIGWLLVQRFVGRPAKSRDATLIGNPWRGSFSFGITGVAGAIHGFLLPIIGWTAGEEEVAVLGAVNKWAQPVTLLASAYASYMFPRLATAPSDRAAIRLTKSAVVFVALGTLVSLLIMVLAPWLIDTFLPDDYRGGVSVLRFFALAAIPVLIGQPALSLLLARHRDRFAGRIMLINGVITFVVAAVLSAWWGAIAVPVVVGAGSVAIAVLAVLKSYRMWHEHGASSLERLGLLDEPRVLRRLAALRGPRDPS